MPHRRRLVDLGLRELTDDQLFELIRQACDELVARDPYLRNLAQATVTAYAEELTVRRAAMKEAVTIAMEAYIAAIREEAAEDLREALQRGEARLLTPEQEGKAAADSTLEAKIQLIDETVAALLARNGHRPTFRTRGPQQPPDPSW